MSRNAFLRRPGETWGRYVFRHGSASLAFYLLVVAALWVFQERAIYPAAYSSPRSGFDENVFPSILKPEMVAVDGGSLFALHAQPAAGKPVVVMFHGNGNYPEDYAAIHDGLLSHGYGIVAPAMRGYPRSSGSPGEEAMLNDAKALVRWTKRKHPGSGIVVLGHSLGSAPAIVAAAGSEVDGLVLMSPFLSMRSIVRSKLPFLPVDTLLRSPYRNDLRIGTVGVPILVLHGTDDWSVPMSSGKALSELATAPVRFVQIAGAGHNSGMMDDAVVDRIVSFVAEAETSDP